MYSFAWNSHDNKHLVQNPPELQLHSGRQPESVCGLCNEDVCTWGIQHIKNKMFNENLLPKERESLARRQMLEEERRRREEAEKRLQDEAYHRQQLVEKEVKMRAKNFSQVSENESAGQKGTKQRHLMARFMDDCL